MRGSILSLAMFAGLSCAVSAQQQFVSSDISTPTTWTSNNTYTLIGQITVLPGATLTVQAGTVIQSNAIFGGSLNVARGGQLVMLGTAANPVIMTSADDIATWDADASHPTGGNPRTGTWRESANEWGNLTIQGRGYVSENATPGNVPAPTGTNVATMEGLIGSGPNDPTVLYGGNDDNDDSGTIQYLSIRYGGRVIALTNELNGLSLGGIGCNTDIHHVEIMNNVDDGIEIWGGTVNLKNVSIWNIGDDSFDCDQGWRGQVQYCLIVQGYSLDASQGSGVGDNGFEIDGAEDSDWQPVTTSVIENFTFIGQPDGDGATAWRDNARVQYHRGIIMDCGERVVRFDNVDGDGANGYGHNGTLTWPATWTTSYTATSTVNPGNPAGFKGYTTQSSGMLAEIKDTVFFNNADYAEAEARGVVDTTAAANSQPCDNVYEPAVMPIRSITRAPQVTRGGRLQAQVISVDLRPAGAAEASAGLAADNGFFDRVGFRGAFGNDSCWLNGWSASSAFGFLANDDSFTDLGGAADAGAPAGAPALGAAGELGNGGSIVSLRIFNAPAATAAFVLIGARSPAVNLFDLNFQVDLVSAIAVPIPSNGTPLNFPAPFAITPGAVFFAQGLLADPTASQGFTNTNLLRAEAH